MEHGAHVHMIVEKWLIQVSPKHEPREAEKVSHFIDSWETSLRKCQPRYHISIEDEG
jgi:hypothetical protein